MFLYYAPDGVVPNGQPFATVVTKDYPGEPSSDLGPGVFRVNIDARRRGQLEPEDPAKRDHAWLTRCTATSDGSASSSPAPTPAPSCTPCCGRPTTPPGSAGSDDVLAAPQPRAGFQSAGTGEPAT